MNAESLYKVITNAIGSDLFPSMTYAGYFGMGGEDLPAVQPVFGVWIGLNRYGLLEKDALKQAIREDKIGEFFEQGRLKLAAKGHGYSLKVEKMNVFFDGLPALDPEPPQDLVADTKLAFWTAVDTYGVPHFHSPETQAAAWGKAERLLQELMRQPDLSGAPGAFKEVLGLYQEAREIYGMRRKTPAGLKELVQRFRASGAIQESESSDENGW